MIEVEKFIKHFQNEGTIKTFTEGCCYWFAVILKERFGGEIMYNPIDGHFATLVYGELYDITGPIEHNNMWYGWDTYKLFDELDYERVVKYCVNKDEK